jgi:subtilisin family serine protease
VVHRQDVMCAAHGSGMAATIAARPRGPGGIVGIAPASRILRLSFGCPKWVELDLKKLPKGEQDRLHLEYLHETAVQGAKAIDWAAEKGAKIISFSTTMVPPNPEQLPESLRLAAADVQAFEQAMQRARARGVLVIAAAGNWTGMKEKADQAEWQARYPEQGLYFPASSEAAIAVGCACGDPGQTCEYVHSGSEIGQPQLASVRLGHNYGPGLDFVGYCDGAPGVIRKGTELVYHVTKEGGTSNAVPELAGVLALTWAAAPKAPANTVVDVVQASCTDLGAPGRDDRFGFGVPNAGRAVERARALGREPR